ncbi:short-chain collagen C4-like [Acanthaster planci]|uniref:Short-chain collagen C4-like n=1 Tax=Acanthaster planci TaxID=133434 RepID=A0A8B7ZYR6_ACAPL|nr:short-chain collagen C4-like [Acanthaster planci]
MAPDHKLPEVTLGGDFLPGKNTSAKNGKFWRWLLAGALLNVCIVSVSVSLTVLYVRTEMQEIWVQILSHEERLEWLENTHSKQDAVQMSVPFRKHAQTRKRRHEESQMLEGHGSAPNATRYGSHERPSGGDAYVRWGRTTCPTHTELVYAGTAAGSLYSHSGGSVDFFCLPPEPEWASNHNDGTNSQSYLYGMEYEVSAFDPFSHENAEFLQDRDVPCAVCRLVDRGTQLLFPAKLGCPASWTEEYRGFLMSGHYNHQQRSKAVCVDQAPEVVPGSQSNANGGLLYAVEGVCGSLLCPPYVNGREITCTVCSI